MVEEQGVKCLVLGGSRDAVQGQAFEESLDFLFRRGGGLGLVTIKKRRVAEEPVGIGFFGVEGEVLESTSFTEQTDCVDNLHKGINERTWINQRTVSALRGLEGRLTSLIRLPLGESYVRRSESQFRVCAVICNITECFL